MNDRPNLRAGFSHYAFELVVIISGITVSFLLNEWRQDRDGRESLRRDLQALELSLKSDRIELQGLIEQREKVEPSMRILLDIQNPKATNSAELQTTFDQMINGAAFCFYPDSGAWKALVASGNLRWIKDADLQGALFQFYDHAVPRITDNNHLADEVIVTGLLAWLASEFPPRKGMTTSIGRLELTQENLPVFRRQLGRALPHTSWYHQLLKVTLEQLDQALTAVASRLTTDGL